MRKIREIALVTATALLMTMCPVDRFKFET